jgi:hypothetical protein
MPGVRLEGDETMEEQLNGVMWHWVDAASDP